jgi:formate transporter
MEDRDAPALDALLPPAMARRAEEVGVGKANTPALRLFVLAVLAGAFISLGAVFSTVVTTGEGVPFGVSRLLGGLAFSLGLVLVVVGGAELFTGNNLIVMAWASRRVTTLQVLRNWVIVYAGNLVGALSVAILVFWSGQHRAADGAVAARVLAIGDAKTQLPFGRAVVLGVLANALVCLAVWLSFSARSVIDRVVAVMLPVTAFVASGFEHSIANMYFVPEAILVRRRASASLLASIDTTRADHPGLTWGRFLLRNLVPVTLGNVIGGAVLVGLVYWFVYLRAADRPPHDGR